MRITRSSITRVTINGKKIPSALKQIAIGLNNEVMGVGIVGNIWFYKDGLGWEQVKAEIPLTVPQKTISSSISTGGLFAPAATDRLAKSTIITQDAVVAKRLQV